jgi:hypothetical protein
LISTLLGYAACLAAIIGVCIVIGMLIAKRL